MITPTPPEAARPTPEVDAARVYSPDHPDCILILKGDHLVPSEVARKLERERDEAREQRDKAGWKCFHCGEVFTEESCAKTHFGRTEQSQPACVIKAGAEGSLLQALRASEAECANAWAIIHNESSETDKALASAYSRHSAQLEAAENLGYERGIKDFVKAEAERDALRVALEGNVAAFDAIDQETPVRPVEPAWWLAWSEQTQIARRALAPKCPTK